MYDLNIAFMGTTKRHNQLTIGLSGNLFELIRKNQICVLQEEIALVYKGQFKKGEEVSLIDVNELDNVDVFLKEVLPEYHFIVPDFLYFLKNNFLWNDSKTKIIGQPDLVVEVWSVSNTEVERKLKFDLYSSSESTEHWYINQDSNIVECWIGKNRIQDQSLKDILQTKNNIKFDLRYLAL